MTQEDKQLLLKDLCARLPYGVKIRCNEDIIMTLRQINKDCFCECWENEDFICHSRWMLPYLRPLSSMTEEEKQEYHTIISKSQECSFENSESATTMVNDWLLSKHFDTRGLIPKRLAIAVTKENNVYKS